MVLRLVALKLRGVNYEYIQENHANKSEGLLKHNPMHRKVPVLVHKGRPLAETLIIAQYIDGIWEEPPLLSEDPYERVRRLESLHVRALDDYPSVAPTSM
ncbi:hypothetical protein Taro_022395 [Colocasia esculenta]|uniref:GST N-terminal domain-containing protein n=1 Tax=Colocasia esculenta TaxID=4460 RepID=A0A843V1G4_COLES|nr:hypothetical protein [Colocasia esculenta]